MPERTMQFRTWAIAAMRVRVLRFHAAVRELSPQQAALLVSVGLVLGVFPIMGCPTVLCLLAAFGLRLNQAALQVINNLSSPLQLALLLPLGRAGALLCGGTGGGGSAAGRLAAAALHAIAGWACICIPLGALLYVILLLAMRKGHASASPRIPLSMSGIS
jgi:hypothetical protein